MANQGVVSVVKSGSVVMKLVAGCNGDKAESVATALKNNWPLDINEAYKIAEKEGFGSIDSLVVLTADEIVYLDDYEIDSKYRDTFNQPEFNPRWEFGTADYVELVLI